MMKTTKLTLRFILAVAILIGMMIGPVTFAEEGPEERGNNLAKIEAFTPDRYACLNINNLWAWQREDGLSNHSPLGDNGVFYPRNTSYVIYEDGIVWGSSAYLDAEKTQPAPYGQTVRVGGSTYNTGSREGWVVGYGANAVPINKDHEFARLFRIRRDYKEMSADAYRQDAADCYEVPVNEVTSDMIQMIKDDYEFSWTNWPVDYGAPFIDRNGNGVYDPPPANFTVKDLIDQGYDEPGVAGSDPNSPADQVIYGIWNDLNKEASTARFGSNPTGLEIQSTLWGYKRADALGNIFFRKIRFINKGGVEVDDQGNMGVFYLDSCYVCQWSDPDLGSAGDDLVGCDVEKSMGFVYNGNAVDIRYRDFGLPPPSGGYDFLQGPAIPSPGETAVFDLKYKQDYTNLGMSGFSYFSAGSPYSDPGGGYDTNTIRWYKMLRGYAPLSGPDVRYNHPPGVEAGPFPLSGDPVLGTGHIDGQGTDYSFVPGDRRLLCITGPWTMAPGDTQEVVVALVLGLGADRLSSISVMKFNDKFAQATYDALFAVPAAPVTPNVRVTELDGKVLLNWASDANTMKEIEDKINDPGGFRFEGYNVYQLPTPQSELSAGMRLATFDTPADPATVLDEGFDQNSGQILQIPVQYGTNSGIQREFIFDRDFIRDVDKVNNGSEYYLVVTSYSVATVPNFLPTSLESSIKVLTVVPQGRGMGEVYNTEYGEVISPVSHPSGMGTAALTPTIVDPDAVRPATYTVGFNADRTWKIMRGGTTLHNGLTNYGDSAFDWPVADGVRVELREVVFEAPLDFASLDVSPSSNAGNYDIDSYLVNGWANTAMAVDAYGDGTTDLQYLNGDIELRFTGVYGDKQGTVIPVVSGGSMATVYSAPSMADHPLNPNPGGSDRFTVRIPFEVWDNERNMQINVLMRDRLQAADSDPFYAFNPAGRMYVFLNALPYQEEVLAEDTDNMLTWNLVFWTTEWTTGDVVTIGYPNMNVPGEDVYTYSTAGLETTVDEALKKEDLERIGVFPNPYYCFNPLEVHKLSRFVTFNNLPNVATIRIFNLAGQLVETIQKNDNTTFARWDLLNQWDFPVASGMYLAHIDVPAVGTTVLKLAVVQEAEVLDVY